jgi:dTDP-4-amino-4,6-dideoxygalactose transaminase
MILVFYQVWRHNMHVKLIDLERQQQYIRSDIDHAITRVLNHGKYILGPEVGELELRLSEITGVRHVIACGSGTDALQLSMLANNIGEGDAVFLPNFSFPATVEVILHVGATPVFVDIQPDDFNIDPIVLFEAIMTTKKQGLNPRAILAVDLFGQPANYKNIQEIAKQQNMIVIADAAQSFGATYKKLSIGHHGICSAISFYPAKPLGCYGDGGAILTNDSKLAGIMRSTANHGQGKKYSIERLGVNSRLDTMQAAILLQKLKVFNEEIIRRKQIAAYYSKHLSEYLCIPTLHKDVTSAWAQYVVLVQDREKFIKVCNANNIETAIHYPKPLSMQKPFQNFPVFSSTTNVALTVSNHIISIPMHPYLAQVELEHIVNVIRENFSAEEKFNFHNFSRDLFSVV